MLASNSNNITDDSTLQTGKVYIKLSYSYNYNVTINAKFSVTERLMGLYSIRPLLSIYNHSHKYLVQS